MNQAIKPERKQLNRSDAKGAERQSRNQKPKRWGQKDKKHPKVRDDKDFGFHLCPSLIFECSFGLLLRVFRVSAVRACFLVATGFGLQALYYYLSNSSQAAKKFSPKPLLCVSSRLCGLFLISYSPTISDCKLCALRASVVSLGFRSWLRLCCFACLLLCSTFVSAAPRQQELITIEKPGQMYEKQGTVRFQSTAGEEAGAAVPQPLGFGEGLRTLALSGAAVRLTDESTMSLWELTLLQIIRRPENTNAPTAMIHRGQAYTRARGKVIEIPVQTPQGHGTPRGTEFLVSVDPEANRTEFTMFDGEVELSAPSDPTPVRITSGYQGIIEPGKPIRVVPILQATNLVQWWIYYPGVLDPDELDLPASARTPLAESLAAYRSGNLAQAMEKFPGYPHPEEPATDPERFYLAALFLAVGAPNRAEVLLARANSNAPPAHALQTLLQATHDPSLAPRDSSVTRHPSPATSSASENLADSYLHQAEHHLVPALAAARASVRLSPNFGFGWARVAELEFSFGRIAAARRAVERSLELSPSNAQALAISGFLLAADNRFQEAISRFEQAIHLEPKLGNAWLGRGLCKRRLGLLDIFSIEILTADAADWLSDLQAAATAEPHRSLLRSYVGKGLVEEGEPRLAEKELNFARKLDQNDPTPWLYSALLKQQQNQINEAIADLEASQQRNDNRSLFRSRLLLDEDRAVRSANLASIYRDAGMTDVSVREAARAVTYDYANDSAHLFLSDSYNELRDPTRFNLRYDTVWFNELLLANLLSPVGGGRLPLHVSQQEYSRLFEQDGLHLASSTFGRSDNESVNELASLYGNFGASAFALDLNYQHNRGVRLNNELDNIEWYNTFKQQLTPQDTFLGIVKYEAYHSGDNFQYYDPKVSRRHFNFDEAQQPVVVGALHHEWSPGMHTLLMGGRFQNEQTFTDKAAPQLALIQDFKGVTYASDTFPFDVHYHNRFEIWLAELNQIFQWNRITLSVGGRYQSGSIQTHAQLAHPPAGLASLFQNPPADASFEEDFQRLSGYGYLTIEPFDHFWLTGGVAYDDITYPRNFRIPPISPGQQHNYQVGPKAGLVWNPFSLFTVRGFYAKSLGGVSEEGDFRLEQTQIAGFPQAFRTLIPESLVGSVSAPEYETYGGALDFKFPSRTYAGIQAQWLNSDVDRTLGYMLLSHGTNPFVPASIPERLRYREFSLAGNLNQLFGDYFTLGAAAQWTYANLKDTLAEVPTSILPSARRDERADLYQTTAYLVFNHPSGFFARADATWYRQHNSGYSPALAGDDFFQENVYIGYRFARRRIEVLLGVLNLAGQDYHLNPLTPYAELPRERSYVARLRFLF